MRFIPKADKNVYAKKTFDTYMYNYTSYDDSFELSTQKCTQNFVTRQDINPLELTVAGVSWVGLTLLPPSSE